MPEWLFLLNGNHTSLKALWLQGHGAFHSLDDCESPFSTKLGSREKSPAGSSTPGIIPANTVSMT